MSSRSRRMEKAEQAAERIRIRLEADAAGIHRLADPAVVLDSELPPGLEAVLREFDGGELFHGSVVVRSSRDFQRSHLGWLVAEVGQDEIWVARDGVVRRVDAELGDYYIDGSSFDHWLAGCIEAEALLIDSDGEYNDELIDEDGNLLVEAAAQRERSWLKRDRQAPGPRWRLAHALLRLEQTENALRELEAVVAGDSAFAWAWYDLARLSERRGAVETACEELECAAAARPDHEHRAFFLAHIARLAAAVGNEARRGDAARRALAARPSFQREQREAAVASLAAGELEQAKELAEIALALEPKDVACLDVMRRLRESSTA